MPYTRRLRRIPLAYSRSARSPVPAFKKDCGDSVAAAGDILYYKSRRGIYAYDGSLPTFVGDALGTDVYDCAVGGALGEKYYVSMRGSNGRYSLFVYDSRKRLWHREDNTAVRQFASIEGELYYTEQNNKAVIRSVGGSGITDSEPVRWYAVSGAISGSMGEHEYLSRLILRIAADQGASVGISVRYDSRGGVAGARNGWCRRAEKHYPPDPAAQMRPSAPASERTRLCKG